MPGPQARSGADHQATHSLTRQAVQTWSWTPDTGSMCPDFRTKSELSTETTTLPARAPIPPRQFTFLHRAVPNLSKDSKHSILKSLVVIGGYRRARPSTRSPRRPWAALPGAGAETRGAYFSCRRRARLGCQGLSRDGHATRRTRSSSHCSPTWGRRGGIPEAGCVAGFQLGPVSLTGDPRGAPTDKSIEGNLKGEGGEKVLGRGWGLLLSRLESSAQPS